jgi:hypothetical protein
MYLMVVDMFMCAVLILSLSLSLSLPPFLSPSQNEPPGKLTFYADKDAFFLWAVGDNPSKYYVSTKILQQAYWFYKPLLVPSTCVNRKSEPCSSSNYHPRFQAPVYGNYNKHNCPFIK